MKIWWLGVALLACLLATHQAAFAQIGTATAAPSCPTGCQPIAGIRAESSDSGNGLQIKVTWELANLPATIKPTGFTVIAKGQAAGRERENSVNVGASARSATILLNDFRRNDLNTFRARVVGRFELTRSASIQATVRKKEIAAAGRDVFLDVEWDNVPNGLSPCEFQGFFVKGSARTDDGKEIEGAQSTNDRNARKLRIQLRGRDGINPTFVSTRATVALITSGLIECGLSTGDQRENQTAGNATLTRAEAESLLRQDTKLSSASSNGAAVTGRFQISNNPVAVLEAAGLIVCPVRANGAVDNGQVCGFASIRPGETSATVNFNPANLVGGGRSDSPAVAFEVNIQTRYRFRNEFILISTTPIRISFNGPSPATATNTGKPNSASPSAASAATTVPKKAETNGASGTVGKAEATRTPSKAKKQ